MLDPRVLSRLKPASRDDRIASSIDRLRAALTVAAAILLVLAAAWRRAGLPAAVASTGPAFATLSVVIAGGVLLSRFGLFDALAGLITSRRVPRTVGPALVLGLTALVSACINLDVAAVVGPSLALHVARRQGWSGRYMVTVTALAANASSFLLPTSNVTNLLLLTRLPLSAAAYLRTGWLAWFLVTSGTIALLACIPLRAGREDAVRSPSARVGSLRLVPALLDLLPMFVIATAVRDVLGTALALHGSAWEEFAFGSVIAATVNNLPAAAAVVPAGSAGLWPAIWSMAIGPNVFITGSIATLICRRVALESGSGFDTLRFSVIGMAMLPAQFGLAELGLHLAFYLPS